MRRSTAPLHSMGMNRPPAPAFSRTVTIDDNRLTFLPDGPDRLAALLELIGSAKKSLRLLYYIYADDVSGALVREALIDAINRGVDVALLIDGFGSSGTPNDYFRELSEAGARFCRFLPEHQSPLSDPQSPEAGAGRRQAGADRRFQYRG